MELLETMRAEDGRIELLDRHLARLAAAGTSLGYPVDPRRIRDDLAYALEGRPEAFRVRLTVDRSGRVDIGLVPLDVVPPIRTIVEVPWPAAGAAEQSRYKTTDRVPYDAALAAAWSAGADEAVLVDEAGLVVEATRANVWVRRGAELLTPPLSQCGLAGVMRAHILDTVEGARVAELSAAELRDADAVLLSNAVRGLFEVRLGTRPGAA